jgi:hypothetical protein
MRHITNRLEYHPLMNARVVNSVGTYLRVMLEADICRKVACANSQNHMVILQVPERQNLELDSLFVTSGKTHAQFRVESRHCIFM